jgi:WD40 repeat protein/predicted Ser/Thr protein kinase
MLLRVAADPRFRRLATLFGEARRLDPGERAAFLRERCPDEALRTELEDLLREHDRGGEAQGQTPHWVEAARLAWEDTDAAALAPAGPEVPPAEVQGFRLLHRIASGGMGSVYEAEQEQPRRRVAVKMLRPEAASPQGLRRFALEAEALARLRHPGIAQIHLFGTAKTPAGQQPFLAMELVDGASLTAFARGLDLPARVELLAKVADAVMHAHLSGVIHRDLKPSNILVTPDGQPKVLDFGIARMADSGVTMHTGTGQVLGTLAYMSPEQLEGDAARVDTRSDVYSLGVVAYEVLCGRLPHEIDGLPLPTAVRRLLDDDPPAPESLDRRLKGDLAAILTTALAREPERRYQSAGALADDFRRYLRDETVHARAPTAGYQLRKFVRRHRTLVASVGGTMLALAAGLALAIHFAHRERTWRLRSDQDAESARRAAAQATMEVAASELGSGSGNAARRRLEEVPADLRGWVWRYLFARTDTSLAHVRLARPSPRSLVFGPADGAPLLALYPDGAALVDPSTGTTSAAPELAGARCSSVVWMGGFPWALVQRVRACFLVRVDTGEERKLELPPGEIASAATADGTRIAMALWGGNDLSPVHVRDARTGEGIAQWDGDGVSMFALAFSPDGRLVAETGWKRVVLLREAATGRLVHRLAGHTADARVLAFSPDGRLLASAGVDRTIRLWRVKEGHPLHALAGHAAEVTAFAFDPAGERLISGASDGAIRIWSVASGACEGLFLGHEGAVLALSAGSAALRSAGADGVRTWPRPSEPDPEVLRVHRGLAEGNPNPYVYAAKFSPDGSMLASGGWDDTVRVVAADTGELQATLETGGGHVFDLAFLPGGRRIVGGHKRHVLWDVGSGSRLAEQSSEGNPSWSFASSPDGRHVAIGHTNGDVSILRTEELAPAATWPGHKGVVQDVAWTGDGTRIASVSLDDGVCLVRSFPEGGVLHRWAAHQGGALAVAFDRGGRRVATGGGDGLVRVWDAHTGADLLRLAGHTDRVFAVAFHPDGDLLASGSNDTSIRLWDLVRGREAANLRGHGSYVYGLDFSPDGATLASASGDNTVRLWSTRTAAEREARARAARARRAGR